MLPMNNYNIKTNPQVNVQLAYFPTNAQRMENVFFISQFYSRFKVIVKPISKYFSIKYVHSGSYKSCPTELYFEEWMSFFKIKFSGAVSVAS